MNLKVTLEQAAADLVPTGSTAGTDGVARDRAVEAVRAALVVEADARRAAAEAAAARAEEAVWLGASLADLASVTGRSRQAARKRWPHLGEVHRRRLWLSRHVDDVLWAVRGLLADARVDGAEGDELAAAAQEADRLFGSDAVDPPDATAAVARWRVLDDLVDRRLRTVLASQPEPDGEALPDQAAFAVHAAHGVLGYFDHAVRGTDADDGGAATDAPA